MTANHEKFKSISDYSGEIKTANNTTMQAVGKGDISMTLPTPRGNEIVTVHEVLHVPDLGMNLLSIKKIVDHQNSVVFDNAGCRILNSAKEVIATGSQVNGLYRLDDIGTKTAYLANATLTDIWHRRFAHLGSENMKLLAKGYVKGVNLSHNSVS